MPALLQANWMNHHQKVGWYGYMNGFMAPPRPVQAPFDNPDDPNYSQPTAHNLNYMLNRSFELATIFTAVAGLLNVLAIYDAGPGRS